MMGNEEKAIVDHPIDVNAVQKQLSEVREQLNNANTDISDIKQRVEEIDRNIKLERYQEKVNAFLLNNDRDWQLRIVKANLIISTAYYPCITYIKNGEFYHIKIKHQHSEEERALKVETNIREIRKNKFLIELICYSGSAKPSSTYYRYIVYDAEKHQAEEMKDPLSVLTDLRVYLNQLGYPLPKRYLRKIQNRAPFNFTDSAPTRRDCWSVREYMDEGNLEEAKP